MPTKKRILLEGPDGRLPEANVPARLSEVGLAVTAVRKSGATQGFDSGQSRADLYPKFTRLGKVFEVAQTTYPSIYWPWLVKMPTSVKTPLGAVTAPLAPYYMYYSTDHDNAGDGRGGIGLATAPTKYGPWTNYGQVYVDLSLGWQTETPSVLYMPWLDAVNPFHMYYQQDWRADATTMTAAGVRGVQSTMLAKSPDGLTWTKVGVALDRPSYAESAGNGHTGYFSAQIENGRVVGYHLNGGGDFGYFSLSSSDDGVKFETDPRFLGYNTHLTQGIGGRLMSWNHSMTFMYAGQRWWVGILSSFTSGGNAKDARIAMCRIADDRRTVLSPLQVIIDGTGVNESVDFRSLHVYVEDGEVLLTYQCGNTFLTATTGSAS